MNARVKNGYAEKKEKERESAVQFNSIQFDGESDKHFSYNHMAD